MGKTRLDRSTHRKGDFPPGIIREEQVALLDQGNAALISHLIHGNGFLAVLRFQEQTGFCQENGTEGVEQGLEVGLLLNHLVNILAYGLNLVVGIFHGTAAFLHMNRVIRKENRGAPV
jgi:hypothetical protein